MTLITWILAAAALVGTVMNVRLDRRCFYVWSVTNVGWTLINWHIGQYAQACLNFTYFLLSLQGVRTWQKRQAAVVVGGED